MEYINKIKKSKAETFIIAGADRIKVDKIAFKCSKLLINFKILVILNIRIPLAIYGILFIIY